jgi:hypothetical protein
MNEDNEQRVSAAGLLQFGTPEDIIHAMNDILAERGDVIRWHVGLFKTSWSNTGAPPLAIEECDIPRWLYAAIECRLIY